MTVDRPSPAPDTALVARRLRLSGLVSRPVVAQDGQRLGKVRDVIVRLDLEPGHHPLVTGLVAAVGRRNLFVPLSLVDDLTSDPLRLTTARLDLRAFERRDGEVLLKGDLLGHRLIDVRAAHLVRAQDVELGEHRSGWALIGIDAAARGWLAQVLGMRPLRGRCRPWSDFEPLIGHDATATMRAGFSRLGRLRPADIADLVEEASHDESEEILDAVGNDKELEADVFEELEPDRQIEALRDRSDAEVADVLAHMSPDDAADLLADLPQERRLPVLEKLPPASHKKIRELLGFGPDTAGGMMTPDLLALAPGTSAGQAIAQVRTAAHISREALFTVYVAEDNRLVGAVTLPVLLQADPATLLGDVAEADPIRVSSDADFFEVAVRMTDFNLVTIPVVDADDHLLGVVTVDDVLEAAVPDSWRDRVEEMEATAMRRRRRSRDRDTPATSSARAARA